jgi:toxin ParE1/3/4
MKSLNIQRRALHDMEEARVYYRVEAPHVVAEFADEIDDALLMLQRHPKSGSPRWGLAMNMAGLRTWPLSQFPYMIFYFERNKHLDIVRVLHQSSDIIEHLKNKIS